MNDMTAKLLIVQGRPAGKRLVFPRGDYYIGRGAECHVRPNSDMVSRQHCLLRVTEEAVFLRDLGSRNGTLVNGLLIARERRLQPGDQVQVGPLVFELQLECLPDATTGLTLEEGEPTGHDTQAEINLGAQAKLEPPAESAVETKDNHDPLKP
jgi:pSer/pThr/pTyr-binding forkhead associated (FHA) protein